MRRIKPLMLALLAVFAFTAIVASAAQAASTEGPWWDISGKRLGPGETRATTATAETNFVLLNKTAGAKIVCKALKFSKNTTINGSTGKNSGGGLGATEFSECSGGGKSESLTTCEPEGGTVTTATTTTTLGYSEANRKGEILVLFTPVSGNFATIKFTGTECIAGTTAVTGSAIALWLRAGVPVQTGEEFLSNKLLFTFVPTEKPTFFYETNGKLESLKTTLTAFGTAATLEGTASNELAGGVLFGILTGCSACTGFGA